MSERDKIEGNSVVFSDLLNNDAAVGERFAVISARSCVADGMDPALAELLYGLASGTISTDGGMAAAWTADED